MKVLITGASSGIGRDFAKILSEMGHDLILVARRKKELEKLKKELKTKVQIINLDISTTFNCMKLYDKVKNEKIDILINNAGFGVYGNFTETVLDKELDMIDTNIKAVHILTKLFLKDFKERDEGYILNVSSSAAFLPGPLMASYYATKAYVLRLTEAIDRELKSLYSNVYVGVLCPGPVDTDFSKVAGVKFNLKAQKSYEVADYAIKKMFDKKVIIIPSFKIKIGCFMCRFLPSSLLGRISYQIQRKKDGVNE